MHPDLIDRNGGASGVLFDNASFDQPWGQVVGFASSGRLLPTASLQMLAALNACQTGSGAAALLDATPVVIAMSDGVGDMSAGLRNALLCPRRGKSIVADLFMETLPVRCTSGRNDGTFWRDPGEGSPQIKSRRHT